jgi:prevent-host-death family protein
MRFVNIRELSKSPSKYVRFANEKEDIVVTRNGHPYAVISRMGAEDMEDFILAKHFRLERDFVKARKEYESGKIRNARDLLAEINHEVSDAV